MESLAEKTKPALEKAGEAIKTTTKHVVDEGKPMVKKVRNERGREGGRVRAGLTPRERDYLSRDLHHTSFHTYIYR